MQHNESAVLVSNHDVKK